MHERLFYGTKLVAWHTSNQQIKSETFPGRDWLQCLWTSSNIFYLIDSVLVILGQSLFTMSNVPEPSANQVKGWVNVGDELQGGSCKQMFMTWFWTVFYPNNSFTLDLNEFDPFPVGMVLELPSGEFDNEKAMHQLDGSVFEACESFAAQVRQTQRIVWGMTVKLGLQCSGSKSQTFSIVWKCVA